MSTPIRVAQWATGAVGKTILRGIIDRSDLELVGLYVYGDRKVGKDAGEIARRETTGVIATRDLDELIATRPQVVMHAPRLQVPYEKHDEDLLTLLRAGINVITTAGQHFPRAHGSQRERLFLDACEEGNSTLFGVGVSPGIIGERLALGLTGASVTLDSITIDEVLDARSMPDPDFAFTVMGMGSDPAQLDGSGPLPTLYAALYLETIAFMCEQMGVTYDEIRPDHVVVPASRDLEVAAGHIAAGTVGSTEWRWHAIVDGKPFLTLAIIWTMEPDREEYAGRDHWTIHFKGKPEMVVTLNLVEPDEPGSRTTAGQFVTAGPALRAIEAVVDAPAGIFEPPVFAPFRMDR
ncbi:NAD(P)H-dependent amine dehydrogenase family protein [Aeromicrobium wangtongii]|uniref:Dihydrodipicolinate reductase n=1 Tax=Aeromicrobium wangtongii TaxID=2969247 RepID=A0ABY5M8P9_9ACTN|nr:dihydrodipicolinate reductase [Aeromicrobium wangtongii]MCD9199873.1 dihydrodipicolinate reductase [Aeromicrobium wangtongii]UUP13491.1 dihydrodipicolinate reductase [Aeromicrobium wangtongii]